jgi:DNA-3-methyladenine glycosylase II
MTHFHRLAFRVRASVSRVAGRRTKARSLFTVAEGALPYDPRAAVRHLAKADPALGKVIRAVGPVRLSIDALQDPFGSLAESIVYQQLTGKAAATIYGRVAKLYAPKRKLRPADILATPDERLRGAGLSRAKAAALKDLAAKTLDGTVPAMRTLEALPDDEIVERLMAVRGIGRWTVEMLLLFRMGRPDVLPATDYGVRKGFARIYRKRSLPAPRALLAYGDRWRPYRSVASWYLWRALELETCP